MALNERDIEKYLVACVKAAGGECRKVKWIGRRGAPDRLVLLPQRPWQRLEDRPLTRTAIACGSLPKMQEPTSVWVELKAPNVKPEPHQLREHERLRALGQRVEVVDSFALVDLLLS